MFVGAVIFPYGSKVSVEMPFLKLDIDEWFDVKQRLFRNFGPVCGFNRIEDWLGPTRLIVPPRYLAEQCACPASFNDRLAWRDSQGRPLLVLRSWAKVDQHALSDDTPELIGCDLLASEEAMATIHLNSSGLLQEVTIKIVRPLEPFDNDE